MRWIRLGLVASLAWAVAETADAQPAGGITDLTGKSVITDEDRAVIRRWLGQRIGDLIQTTDPEARDMTRSRREIVDLGRQDAGYSAAFVQAYGQEAVALLGTAYERAVSAEARINIVMAAADLRRVEGIPFLLKVLTTDEFSSVRYLAAKGLSEVAPVVVERGATRAEQAMAEGIQRGVQGESNALTFFHLFEALGPLDHEDAHDALALAAGRAAMAISAAEPMGSRALEASVTALERSYKTDVRPAGKQRTLMAYAFLCAWVKHDPPPADPDLMGKLHASLTRLTGEEVEFSPAMGPLMQKLALLEWVERLVATRRIPRRPALPPAVERAVKAAVGSSSP